MNLPGLTTPAFNVAPLVLTPGTYAQLVTDTLGNAGDPSDGTDQLIQALRDGEAAFAADVAAETITDSLSTGSIFGGITASLTALGVEMDLESDFQIISDLLSGLGIGIDVLSVLNAIFPAILDILTIFENDIVSIVLNIVGLIDNGSGPGLPPQDFNPDVLLAPTKGN